MIWTPFWQHTAPILTQVIMFGLMIGFATWVDKKLNFGKAYLGFAMALLLMAFPMYYLKHLGTDGLSLVSNLILLVFVCVGFSLGPGMIYQQVEQVHNKALSLGIGYNMNIALFGGFSPFVISYLSQFGEAYAGFWFVFCALLPLLGATLTQASQEPQKAIA